MAFAATVVRELAGSEQSENGYAKGHSSENGQIDNRQAGVRYRLVFEDHVFRNPATGRHFVAGMVRKANIAIDEALFHYRDGRPIGQLPLRELAGLQTQRQAVLAGRLTNELSPQERTLYRSLGQKIAFEHEIITTPMVRWWSSAKTIEIVGMGTKGMELVDENIIKVIRVIKSICGETPRMMREYMTMAILDKNADDLQSYNIRSLVVANATKESDMSPERWRTVSEQERRDHIISLIIRGIDTQASIVGMVSPISEDDIVLVEHAPAELINAVNAMHSWDGRHHAAVMLRDVFIKMPYELKGLWQCGRYMSRGNGRINFLGRGDTGFERIREMTAYSMRNARKPQ